MYVVDVCMLQQKSNSPPTNHFFFCFPSPSLPAGILTEIAGVPGYLVAIKTLNSNCNPTEILQEAAIMAQFQHENIVGWVI